MSKYTYKKILSKAKSCKSNVEKKQELGINSKWSYYFAKSILNPGKDIKKISFDNAPNPTGTSINKTINSSKYKSIAKDYVEFVENKKNRRLPNFAAYGSYKIKPHLLTYAFAKIIVFYDDKKRLPNNVSVNSKALAKKSNSSSKSASKHGHATKKGCDNMGQNTGYYCGPHSFQEVIRNLYGIVIPQKTIASVMGTTTSGTGHDGFYTVVAWFNKKYNKKLVMTEKYFSDVGVSGVKKIIKSDNQDLITHIAYRLKYGHYENVNSISGSTWNIQNSLGNKCSSCYCGYKESRTESTEKSYINAKTGVKSILIFTRK